MPEKIRKQPLRKCVGCESMLGKKGLLRIVKLTAKIGGNDGEAPRFELDETGKKPGRGAYICRNPECFKIARKKRSLERSLKCKIPDEIYTLLLGEIEGLSPEATGE